MKEQVPVLAPYRRFHYSNLGIAVAGRALAHAAGKTTTSYEALLGTEVLAPLGMVNATFDTSEALAADRIAVGVHPERNMHAGRGRTRLVARTMRMLMGVG